MDAVSIGSVRQSAKPPFDATHLACPLDGTSLHLDGARLVCARGHSFDVARQGYVNLLPVQHKRSSAPGDSQAMVQARAAFLGSGVYEPIAARAVQLALASLPADRRPVIVDAGCGEGYYLDRLHRALLAGGGGPARLIGIDISKPAIMAAARRNRAITWLVASNARPPLVHASVDLLLCGFGFASYPAFRQVLRPGGRILLLDPGPDHLLELRQLIYPEVRRRPPPGLAAAEAAGFRLLDTQTLRYRTEELDAGALQQLLVMTPHLYRASAAGKAAAAGVSSLALTVEVVLRVLELVE